MMKSLREFYEWQQTKKKSYEEMTHQEKELKAKFDDLENDRKGALSDGDEKKLERIDKDLAANKRKLEITGYQRQSKLKYDPEECAPFAEKIRKEATQELEKKQQEDEKLREKITKAKQEYLQLVAEHHALVFDSSQIEREVNEALSPLESSLKKEAERLHMLAQEYDRRIYDGISTGTGGRRSESEEQKLEELHRLKGDALRRAGELRTQTIPLSNGLRDLKSYNYSGVGNPYFVHEDEQLSAAEGKPGKFKLATPTSGESEFAKINAGKK